MRAMMRDKSSSSSLTAAVSVSFNSIEWSLIEYLPRLPVRFCQVFDEPVIAGTVATELTVTDVDLVDVKFDGAEGEFSFEEDWLEDADCFFSVADGVTGDVEVDAGFVVAAIAAVAAATRLA